MIRFPSVSRSRRPSVGGISLAKARPSTTIKSLSEAQIRGLRAEAVGANDLRMMVICDVALDEADDADDYMTELQDVVRTWSQNDAYEAIIAAINDAAAQA